MLIYDRCKLVSEFIVASTWFTLHGVPPRLTQGDWHEISIPYTHHRVFLVLSSPCAATLFTHVRPSQGFPVFTPVQIAPGLFTLFGVNFGVRFAPSQSDGRRRGWLGRRVMFCVLLLKRGGALWWLGSK